MIFHRYFLQIFTLLGLLIYLPSSFAVYPPPVMAQHAMVVSAHPLASAVGVAVLKQGGNAVDAAVAVGYALAVVFPAAGNLGGGGFMTLHLADGRNLFLNFREKAPLAATRNMYLDAQGRVIPGRSTKGYAAVAVPGTVLGLNTALAKYGRLSRQQVMAPAIQLATQGFVLTDEDVKILQSATVDFQQQAHIAAIFLKKNQPFHAGDRLVQPELGNSLKAIAKGGSPAFYQGTIAQAIVKASQTNGGLLTEKDFQQYTVQELTPIRCDYQGYTVISAPPPSSGGVTLCEMLTILSPYPLGNWGFHSAQSLHYLVEAMRYAYYDRNNTLGDPDFVHNPVTKLLSPAYAQQIRNRILSNRATPSSTLSGTAIKEGRHTTHYSIVDKEGNAVSVTYTLNSRFGARVIAGNTGFFLNDEMDDFTSKVGVPNQFGLVQGVNNAIQPGKRPLSSMTPTIVLKGNRPILILGAPGGSTITTAVLQTILNVIEYHLDIKTAVDLPRIHFQWLPDEIQEEPLAISRDTKEKLMAMGYRLTPALYPLAYVEAILIDPTHRLLYGASDDRLPLGLAMGY